MPIQYPAEPSDAERVQELLHIAGAKHLRARKRGASIIVESGPDDDPVKHIRVRRDTAHLWCLDVADHRGKWERTPFREQLASLVDVVINTFPWLLSDHD
jgi:hypothetical protein